jgi:8-oxo-dGTP pyrophosphatase MutT (NUDIX family)
VTSGWGGSLPATRVRKANEVVTRTEVPDHELPQGAGHGRPDVDVVPASSVLLLRDGPLEVLMMQRHAQSSFVPAVWVFPGGTLDDHDKHAARSTETVAAMKICALRELFEETGIWLGGPLADPEKSRQSLLAGRTTIESLLEETSVDPGLLTLTARWITPAGIPKRFDTWFFLAEAGRDVRSTPQPTEATDLVWIRPLEALARHAQGDFPLVFPTIRNLEAIGKFSIADELIESRRHAVIPVTRPVLVVSQGRKSIVLPDEPC